MHHGKGLMFKDYYYKDAHSTNYIIYIIFFCTITIGKTIKKTKHPLKDLFFSFQDDCGFEAWCILSEVS